MHRVTWFITVVFVFMLLAQAVAQTPEKTTFEIDGKVIDISGAVVQGAAVALRNVETGFERLAKTDLEGTFVFAGIRRGSYLLAASAKGFATDTAEVALARDVTVNFVLTPAPLFEDVTVISGSRQEELRDGLSTKVEVVSREEIRDFADQTVAEALRSVPGVLTRRGSETAGPAGEQIQGIDSRQVLVLLDGQPVVGARGIKRGGVVNLDRQTVGSLERIEIVKGASSALYGSDAIGGVINLISQETYLPYHLAFETSGGSLGAFDIRGSGGFHQGRTSGFVALGRHKNNGFDLTPTTFDTTGAGLALYSGLAKLKYEISPSLSVTGLAHGYGNRQVGRSIGELGSQYDDDREQTQNYSLTTDWVPSPRTTVQARGYIAQYRERLFTQLARPGAQPSLGTLQETLGKIDTTASRAAGERHLIQAGAEWWIDRYQGENRLSSDDGQQANTTVFWMQDKFIATRRTSLTVGSRFDRHSVFGLAVSPKAAVNLRLRDGVQLRASYGRGFRAPDLGQLYYRFLNPTNLYQVIGNPHLKPEYSHSWQAGAEYGAAGRRVRLGFNLFLNQVDDLIDSVNLGFVATPRQLADILERERIDPSFRPQLGRLLFLYKNISNVTTRGVEVDGDIVLGKRITAGGAHTFLDARDADSHLRLTGRHRHHGTVHLGWIQDRTGLRMNLRGTFYGGWVVSRQGAAETIASQFAIWDGSVAKRFPGGVELFLSGDNLFNSRDPNVNRLMPNGSPTPIYRFEAGRTLRVGMRFASRAKH